jgi:CheY-like chemotaxis protein
MLPKRLTLLLVEDDEGHATLIQMNLQDGGLKLPIHHVSDGQAALEYVKQVSERRDLDALLILLDLNLPIVDGFDVLQNLKSNNQTQKIPVIILTSSDDSREINRCYEMGCNVFLRKPVEYADFAHAVKQLGIFISLIDLPGVN